jgi:hypothetical protein
MLLIFEKLPRLFYLPLWIASLLSMLIVLTTSAYADKTINQTYAAKVMRSSLPGVHCEIQADSPHCFDNVGNGAIDVFVCMDLLCLKGTLRYNQTPDDQAPKWIDAFITIPTSYGFSKEEVSGCFADAKARRGGYKDAQISNKGFKLTCEVEGAFSSGVWYQFDIYVDNSF